MNQLPCRYVHEPKFTNQVLEDLPDLNQSTSSENINLENTINLASTSSPHVTLLSPSPRPSTSIEPSASTTFRVCKEKSGNWKRIKKEPAVKDKLSFDSDTNTADLCSDSSTEYLDRFVNSPEQSAGSSEESDGSTSPPKEDHHLSFDVLHDDLLLE